MLACIGIGLKRTADLVKRSHHQLVSQSSRNPAPETSPGKRQLSFSKLSIVSQGEGVSHLQALLTKVDGLLISASKLDRQAALCMLENSPEELGQRSDILLRKDLASFDGDPQTQNKCSIQAAELAARALEMDPEDPNCNKWFAITAGKVADISGNIRRRVGFIETFTKHMGKVLDADPDDSLANHTMGVLALRISEMTWIERRIVRTGFGTNLPSYTVNQALELFMKAEQNTPHNAKTNRLYVAKCYLAKDNKQAAGAWLMKAKEALAQHPTDIAAGTEIHSLLQKL